MQAPEHLSSDANHSEKAGRDRSELVSLEGGVSDQISLENGHAVRYRTCSWQKTAGLLFSEYICLAILSFPWAFSLLGMVPGILVTIGVAATVQYTSLILWRLCLEHPEIRDVCDVARVITGGSELAYRLTVVMFILNNVFIQALHCVVGAELLNTLSGSSSCTITFSAVTAIICFLVSLPRTLSQLSYLGVFAAVTMGASVLLVVIFSGVQTHPFDFTGEAPIITVWASAGTSYVSAMSAFLNISYTLIGQITLPSFIAEMKNPRDFPKALWAVTISEVIVFTLAGAIVYHFTGNQYIVAPAVGSLQPVFKKIAFCFAIPTIVYLGSLYSSVTARFLFFRIFRDSEHKHSNTPLAWGVWAAIIAATWVLAFIIAEVIPFFSDMLSLMSSLFDGWFGFIFWGMSYMVLYPGRLKWANYWRIAETLVNYLLIIIGLYILGAGSYVSVQSIIDSYQAGTVGGPFSCASNGV
ncbi:uncharacterized protein STEHIDRAFT_101802 [Stereum hirsutum FP-91666 SS1]|uniref:uncharacterized protein n=1 Tax=Stereum hirsutum (strain FP-91666) TaxID=721885 RepID=UPI000444A2DC|nr:uncharacterized protein STEHIDRAFT_101802 [Stereum hirsutum FP-91666 SS1]EIM83528.1 hypothetical protein STEHIDRAFT_101802 [Stereum hirsutum FP-91666 SS1]